MNQDPDIKNMPAPSGDPNGQPPADGQDPTPTVGGAGGGGKKTMWIWIIVIVLLLSALLFGWWWMNKDEPAPSNNTQTSEQQTAEEVACAEGLTEYTNADLDIGFCYPTTWGDVTVTDARLQKVESTVDGTVIAVDTGQRWQLSFSEKPAVNFGLVTADWSTQIGRGGSCVDPATSVLPAFSPFSTAWEEQPTIVSRGIEVMADEYLIEETADEYHNGVCIYGYTIINAEDFTHSTATYYKEFGGAVTTPEQHAASPNTLAPEDDRNDFYAFVKSVHAL